MEPDWKGFRIRLGRAIDRWPGGGQRDFAEELKAHARKTGTKIPTSARTLINYLQGETRPSRAWVDAAAEVLRWNPDHLLAGVGPERPGGVGVTELSFESDFRDKGPEMGRMLLDLLDDDTDRPWGADMMIFEVLLAHFEGDEDGWEPADRPRRQEEVNAVLRAFYGPLLARPRMRYHETMALTATLTAAAYLAMAGGGRLIPDPNAGNSFTRSDSEDSE